MQQKVQNFNQKRESFAKPMPVYARICDIQSEIGELAKEYLKASNYGENEFVLSQDFELEFGDVLYSLLSLATETGVDANSCLDKILDKYQKRIDKNKTLGSGN